MTVECFSAGSVIHPIPYTLYMYINQNKLTLCGMELINKFNILLKSSKNVKCLMDIFKAIVDLHITCEGSGVTADSHLFYIPIIHVRWNSFSINNYFTDILNK